MESCLNHNFPKKLKNALEGLKEKKE